MSTHAGDLLSTVLALRPFVPARNFEVSTRFYVDFGFRLDPLGDALAELRLGRFSFLLQGDHTDQWAGDFVMHMLVDDMARWWNHIASLDLPSRYGVEAPRPPRLESWGLNVAYVFDPSGVVWHIAARPGTSAG